MKERVNKPRAFLSYSSQDLPFIERIEADLRRCQIETWRDRTEIRDGQAWQEAIFEDGLPTCDVIIAYFTESSLNSGMVAKEVDAAQIRQLKDNGISFLPYVSESNTRGKLRLDIQTLHCRVWNDENYHEIMPSVVAEIWRSYMERSVGIAVLQERNKRLELEIELQNLKAQSNASGFTSQEEKEFRYIYQKLDEPREILIRGYKELGMSVKARFSFLKFLSSFTSIPYRLAFDGSDFQNHILARIKEMYPDMPYLTVELKAPMDVELRTYGFTELKDNTSQPFLGLEYQFTPRLDRFRFWLEVNELYGETPLFDIPPEVPASDAK